MYMKGTSIREKIDIKKRLLERQPCKCLPKTIIIFLTTESEDYSVDRQKQGETERDREKERQRQTVR